MYKLKIPVEKITLEQWREIFNTLREYDDYGYVIMDNEEESFEEWFGNNLIHLAYLIYTSARYDVHDKYVLLDVHSNILFSGDESLILSELSTHLKDAVDAYLEHLENGDFILPKILDGVFKEYE